MGGRREGGWGEVKRGRSREAKDKEGKREGEEGGVKVGGRGRRSEGGTEEKGE